MYLQAFALLAHQLNKVHAVAQISPMA